MKDTDIQKFVSELPQSINDAKLHFEGALTHVDEPLKYEDELSMAKKMIDKSIRKFEKYFKRRNAFLNILIRPSIVKIPDIYNLAGEIYSYINEEKSLEYYKVYQYYTFRNWLTTIESQSREEKFGYHDRKFYGVTAYKFRSCSPDLFTDLAKKQITLSKPCCMNELFDSLYSLWSRPENPNSIVKDKKHIKMFRKSFDYYRLCSFCIDDDDKSILKNNLMWTHYANEHKGVCIRYKLMDNCISSSLSLNVHRQTCLHRIHYYNCIDKKPISVNNKSIKLGALFAQKEERWEYEKESRLICFDDTTVNDRLAIPYKDDISVEAVYFGLDCSEDDKATIKKILKGKLVIYYDMRLNFEDVNKMDIVSEK